MFYKTKYKINLTILIPIIIFAIISIITIYSSEGILIEQNNYALRQTIWYGIGILITILIMYIGNEKILQATWILYIFGTLLLVLLLFFGTPLNNSKCWFIIPGIGAFQPSEFMKIILIMTLSVMIKNFHNKYNKPTTLEEFLFLFKVLIVVAIPSILTFLQPDTGVVLIYLLITFIMLFISGIRYRWFIILFLILTLSIGSVLFLYLFNTELFIEIFGTSFFLRLDRLLDWSSGSGYQLENGITAIGSGGLFGQGFNQTPIYFPEPQTDFIFAVYASNFGFIGSLGLIGLILFFDIRLIILAINSKKKINKYLISGIVAMLLYQQIQNIGMTYGLLPITGITLPFISYGGSSLLSYMIMLGIIFNIANEEKKHKYK